MKVSLADLRRQYGNQSIDVGSVDVDPLEQFRIWFAQAVEAEIYEPNGMTLATVSSCGRPSCRIVLLKGISEGGFVFFTGYGSQKGREIAANQAVALLFWWDRIHRQVRIEGTVTRVSESESDDYFHSRPLESRRSASASAQSQTVLSREELERAVARIAAEYGASPPRPADWGGYRVKPDKFEFWQGRDNRLHDRIRYTPTDDGVWCRERLAP